MKASSLDYVLSTLALCAVGAIAFLVAYGLSDHVWRPMVGDFHVLADVLVFLFSFGLLCALTARLLLMLRPLGQGTISMGDPRFVVWKLYTVLYEFGCGALKPYTVMFMRPVVQSLFGARIGKDVALGGKLVDSHMVTVADEAIIGEGSVVTAHAIISGFIVLEPVVIGRGATVGVGAVIYPGVTLGDDAVVAANAVVLRGTQIPPAEFWGGVPARCLRRANEFAQT